MAGGSGGHLFPAISLTEEIKLRGAGDILFITSGRTQDRAILEQKGIKFRTLPVLGLQSKKVFFIFNFLARLITGTLKSFFLLLQFRPSVVIGFGGYVSGPILLLSALLRIKTVIHEQNVYPGKTNRILARFVDKIAISFPETRRYLNGYESKVILSGNPLRRGLKKNHKEGDRFIALTIGGSQGAHTLNTLLPEAVNLMQGDKRKELDIIHISGHVEKDEVIKSYRDRGIKSRVFSFTEDIDKFYNESDFVIARAGATTVSELLFLRKPSILVPYPYGNAHQYLNAKVLEEMGCTLLLEEKHLTAEVLRDAIMRLMNRDTLKRMSDKAQVNVSEDACNILIKEALA